MRLSQIPIPEQAPITSTVSATATPTATPPASPLQQSISCIIQQNNTESTANLILPTQVNDSLSSFDRVETSPLFNQNDSLFHQSECTTSDNVESSDSVQKYMGRRKVANTEDSNRSSIRRFTVFVSSKVDLSSVGVAVDRKNWLEYANRMKIDHRSTIEDSIDLVKNILFTNKEGNLFPKGYTEWSDEDLKKIQYYLMEFAVRYRKEDGGEVTPPTMKGYIAGLQRFFEVEWGYKINLLSGHVFAAKENSLRCVLDNLFNDQQSRGLVTKSHNVLSYENLLTLYKSAELSQRTPTSFLCRLIFHIALCTAMRATELHQLNMSQVSMTTHSGEEVIRIVGIVGNLNGASKNAPGGMNAIKSKPKEIFIRNKVQMDGNINVYEDIKAYIEVRNNLTKRGFRSDRFFTAVNPRGTSMQNFFKAQHLGIHTMRSLIKTACSKNNICGIGANSSVVTHSLRGTATSLLIEAGVPDSAITLRTGHRQVDSLKSYQTLRGMEGKKQQDILFSGSKRLLNDDEASKVSSNAKLPKSSETLQVESVNDIKSLVGAVNCSGGTVNLNFYSIPK